MKPRRLKLNMRQLNAGADLFKARRLVEYGDAESVTRNRQSRGQPPRSPRQR